jgi:hypothetical protein
MTLPADISALFGLEGDLLALDTERPMVLFGGC